MILCVKAELQIIELGNVCTSCTGHRNPLLQILFLMSLYHSLYSQSDQAAHSKCNWLSVTISASMYILFLMIGI